MTDVRAYSRRVYLDGAMHIYEKALARLLKSHPRAELAKEIGVSPQHLCDVAAGRRDFLPTPGRRVISERVLAYLGYERVTIIRKSRNAPNRSIRRR